MNNLDNKKTLKDFFEQRGYDYDSVIYGCELMLYFSIFSSLLKKAWCKK